MNELNLVIHLVSYHTSLHAHHTHSSLQLIPRYQCVLLVSCILASYPVSLWSTYWSSWMRIQNHGPFECPAHMQRQLIKTFVYIGSLWRYQRVLVFDYPSVGWEGFGSMRSIQWVKCYVWYVFLSILGLKEWFDNGPGGFAHQCSSWWRICWRYPYCRTLQPRQSEQQ